MNIGWARVHNTLYLGYVDGDQWIEIDDDDGEWWTITYKGKRIKEIRFRDIREAKQAAYNMVTREIEED